MATANASLHDLAMEASADIRQLATGLAHAGADPQAVQGLGQMAAKLDQVASVLNKAPEVEQNAKTGPGAQAPGAVPPGHPGAPSGLAPGAPGGPPPNGAFGPASAALQQQMQQSAARTR